MAVQLEISFEKLLELVDQLDPEHEAALVRKLLMKRRPQELTPEEKIALLDSLRISVPLAEGFDFSDRREDWYDDDGR